MTCLTNECITEYLDKLEKSIAEYMEMPVSQRSSEAVESMVEAWEHIKGMQEKLGGSFSKSEAEEWCKHMKNSDGTEGGHWSITETDSVGRPEDVSDYVWNAAMNMIYSDYGEVAKKYGVGTAEFFADMTEAFLYDEDGPGPTEKIARYYKSVAR